MQILDRSSQQYAASLTYLNLSQAEAALPGLQRALAAGDWPSLLLKIGNTYHLLGRFEEAKMAYGKWLTTAPPDDPRRKEVVEWQTMVAGRTPLPDPAKPPPRPALPEPIADSVWEKLETAPAYVHYKATTSINSSFSDQLRLPAVRGRSTLLITEGQDAVRPISPKFVAHSKSYRSRADGSTTSGDVQAYRTLGGLLTLIQIENYSGTPTTITKVRAIERIDGSLYPPVAGASMTIVTLESIWQPSTGKADGIFRRTQTCRMGSPVLASSFRPDLPGNAYEVQCTENLNQGGNVRVNTKSVHFFDGFATTGDMFLYRSPANGSYLLPGIGHSESFGSGSERKVVSGFDLKWN